METVLNMLGPSPSDYLKSADPVGLHSRLDDFRHRFTPGSEVVDFLFSISSLQKQHGTTGNFFCKLIGTAGYMEALDLFVCSVLSTMDRSYLLPRPSRGSACKRLHLFMRWMVRQDDVDPGGWSMISPSDLIVPVDVHMFRVGKCLGFTERKAADGKTALEITEGFRKLSPDDPVKYDFALTRFGIQNLKDCSLFRKLFS